MSLINDRKKAIHIIVYDDKHAALKSACAENKITMQDFLETCINMLIEEHPGMTKLARKISRKKKDKTLKRITSFDADIVYEAISGKNETEEEDDDLL